MANRKVLYTPHAIKQMNPEDRLITKQKVREVICSGEIIEDYPDDKRSTGVYLMLLFLIEIFILFVRLKRIIWL